MNQTSLKDGVPTPRLLVAITSYGHKHIEYLKRVIHNYQNLSVQVDVVVLTESPKNLGGGVREVVGLPSPNPWSLPFAHKQLFAENVDRYDLFAYSEDDIEFTEANLRAFLRAMRVVKDDEIPGFLLYEVDSSGNAFILNCHATYHWKPDSVRHRGEHLFAEFTNEHSAFYLLTQSQLRRAIASGGFLRGPCQGRYDMLCTAATDPYTNCGMRKVICISEPERFCLHHIPDSYAGHLGLPLADFNVQIEALKKISKNAHPVSALCQPIAEGHGLKWAKGYYETPCAELLPIVPEGAKSVLSIGCGWGVAETMLVRRGIAVAALPLDSVIGAIAAAKGIDIIHGSLEEGLRQVEARRFDVVLMSNLLHLQPDPFSLLRRCAGLLRPGGSLLLDGPNFEYLPLLARRMLKSGVGQKLGAFSQGGVHPLSIVQINRWCRAAGLENACLVWQYRQADGSLSGSVAAPRGLARFSKRGWRLIREAGRSWDAPRSQPAKSRSVRPLELWLRPGRWLAQGWVLRAVKQK